MRNGIKFLLENSLFLIIGAVAGLVWANLDHEGYEKLLHLPLLSNDWIGVLHDGHRVINLHYLVNDFLMALSASKTIPRALKGSTISLAGWTFPW